MKTVARGYGLRTLNEGVLVVNASEGAWPLSVRDDNGRLTIYLLEKVGAKPAEIVFTLLRTGVEIEGRLDSVQFVGSGMVSGHVWHVFEGKPS